MPSIDRHWWSQSFCSKNLLEFADLIRQSADENNLFRKVTAYCDHVLCIV